jgi:hypothetical protein
MKAQAVTNLVRRAGKINLIHAKVHTQHKSPQLPFVEHCICNRVGEGASSWPPETVMIKDNPEALHFVPP